MQSKGPHDYNTYRELLSDLLSPITGDLDTDTLKRLYESKLVYLENLRQKCFYEINAVKDTSFTHDDYALILEAIQQTHKHLKLVILGAITTNLSKRKVS